MREHIFRFDIQETVVIDRLGNFVVHLIVLGAILEARLGVQYNLKCVAEIEEKFYQMRI